MVVTRSGKSTTAVIAKVPPEILACIFQWFCSHCCNEYKWPSGPPPGSTEAHDTSALFKLCLVSQSFRNVAQGILFHSFNPSCCIPPEAPPWNKYWKRRLEPFLQTVAARPDLARSVKAVFMTRALTARLDLDYSRKAFQACVRALGKSPRDMFRMDSGSIERPCLLSPLSFPEVGNMDRLRAYTHPKSEDFCEELFSVLVAILPNLTHLAVSKSQITPEYYDVVPDVLDSLGVRDIPTIKTIETHEPPLNLLRRCTKIETWITDGRHGFHDMPTVKHLHLRQTYRHPRVDYSKCIKACSGSLTTISCADATEDLFEAIDIPRIHNSLDILHLDAIRLTPIPSLTEFDNLKYVFLHTASIYGKIPVNESPVYFQSIVKVLPRNIVVLSVFSCCDTRDRWERDLFETLADEDDLFPALGGVISNEEISRKDLVEICDLLGIEWVCRKQRGFPMHSSYSNHWDII